MGVKGRVCRTRVRKESSWQTKDPPSPTPKRRHFGGFFSDARLFEVLGSWALCFSRSKDGGGGGGGATRRKSETRRAETDGQSEAKPGACDEKRRSE
ncbi:hypothetical protein HDU99_006194, partial [Rhizoclosmatium hyalinum]